MKEGEEAWSVKHLKSSAVHIRRSWALPPGNIEVGEPAWHADYSSHKATRTLLTMLGRTLPKVHDYRAGHSL